MKIFQKIFLVAICFLIAVGASAQSRLTYGIKGGVNLSESTGTSSTDNKVGYNAGVTLDYQLNSNWYLMTGLELTTKGAKNYGYYTSYGNSGYGYGYGSSYGYGYGSSYGTDFSYSVYDLKQNLMYLQVPIHLGYKVDIGASTRLVFAAGPYVAYGIAGKTKGDLRQSNPTQEGYNYLYHTVDYKSFGNGNRRFDLGLGASMGVEFGKFGVNIGYDWGLINVTENVDSKNRNAYLSVGYKF